MMRWAQADAAAASATPGVQWLVAVFHHPPYSKGTHDSDTEIELMEMRRNFLPMLVSHTGGLLGVDVFVSRGRREDPTF
jgi:hypothetical protein